MLSRPQIRTTTILVVCLLLGAPLYAADRPITVGLVFDGLTQAEREPLQAYLTREMGRPVSLVAPDLYSVTVAHLADGSFDFACLGGLMYIRAHAQHGVIPLVQRTDDLLFHSVFITATNSSIHSLQDLNGKQFAFGDVNSASAHLIPYRELKRARIDPETDLKARFSGSHVATAALVESGMADAGALDESVFRSLLGSGKLNRNRVRVFYTSKPFIDYVYVARRDVPEAERQRFAHALLALQEGKDDAVLRILRATQFVAANDQEYNLLRQVAHELKMF
ncbi:MAG: phosphate/phosphite/phosphonate ABC transporter substrate-binding protein [Terriglobales bacterium]|jgi:phosphonate transport system substrate-binding protein